jgi:HlyD family secretion protein
VSKRPLPRRGLLARIIPAGALAAAIAVVLVIALGQLGGATSSARTEREVVSAADGVVQSTVTGTGNLEPVTEEDVGFQTSGTLHAVDVKQGEYVHKGQLLATLDSATAALTLKQARATLAVARTTLTDDRKTLAGEADDSSSSDDTSAAVGDSGAVTEDVSDPVTTATTAAAPATTVTTLTTTVTTPATTVTTSAPATTPTTPTAATTPTTPTAATTTTTPAAATGRGRSTSTATTHSEPTTTTTARSTTSGSGSTSSSSGASSDVTAATIDSDQLAIVNDEQTVKEDETDVNETRLTAPVSGTITTLESIVPGDSISSGSDTNASDSSSADTAGTDGSTGSDATGAASSASDSTAGSSSTGATTSSSASSSSSTFAEIDTLHRLSMSVSFTEADISELKVGQAATVTLDALSDTELAGKVTAVSSLGTTDDDVVSYDATITLDQYDAQVKPGMSASAAVVIKQGHGVTVPSGAVTGTGTLASVTEDSDGKDTTKQVIVGLRGTSRDLIVSGLKSGAELVETETLPSKGSSADGTTTSGSGASSAAGGLSGGGFARGGFGGGGAGGFGGGGGAAAGGGGGAR